MVSFMDVIGALSKLRAQLALATVRWAWKNRRLIELWITRGLPLPLIVQSVLNAAT